MSVSFWEEFATNVANNVINIALIKGHGSREVSWSFRFDWREGKERTFCHRYFDRGNNDQTVLRTVIVLCDTPICDEN